MQNSQRNTSVQFLILAIFWKTHGSIVLARQRWQNTKDSWRKTQFFLNILNNLNNLFETLIELKHKNLKLLNQLNAPLEETTKPTVDLTIQKRVSLANHEYSSMVESTLKIRQMSTTMNLKKIKIYDRVGSVRRQLVSRLSPIREE